MRRNSRSVDRICEFCEKPFRVDYPCRENRFCGKSCAAHRPAPGFKKCIDCQLVKLAFEFYSHSGHCKVCRKIRQREWRKANHERNRKIQSHGHLKRNFGISLEQYRVMHAGQNGCCAICKKPETHTIKGVLCTLAVDHDHDTGNIRALLCGRCNKAIGLFDDRPELLREAANYISSFAPASLNSCQSLK